jgi:hypothetical protein
VPLILPLAEHAIVFLYSSVDDALAGRIGGGCGFLLAYKGDAADHRYIVTAAHVVIGGARFVRTNTLDGRFDVYEPNWKVAGLAESEWQLGTPRDDLAVASFSPSPFHNYTVVPNKMCLTVQEAHEYAVGPGNDVWMIGRYRNQDEREKNRPVARFGNLAAGPSLVTYDWHFGMKMTQESFLVEMRSISGYSGSPVFLGFPRETVPFPQDSKVMIKYKKALDDEKAKRLMYVPEWPNFGPWLLGVDWGHLKEPPHSSMTSGISGVVPAWKLAEFLEEDEFRMQRQKDDENLPEPGGVADTKESL